MAERWGHQVWGPPGTTRRRFFRHNHWYAPVQWNAEARQAGERRRVFCASMADVFEVDPLGNLDSQRARLWLLIEQTPHLDWLLLTKRPEQIGKMLPPHWLETPRPNVWLGTSVEDQERANLRIPRLLAVPAVVHWLSCEPLLGPVDLTRVMCPGGATGPVCWVVAGGESGPQYRPMDLSWARSLRDQCIETGAAFFYKQGAHRFPGRDTTLDGREWHQFPEVAPCEV